MFVISNKVQLEKAIIKAKTIRTKVKFIAFGKYEVRGTKGNFYKVKCERTVKGEKQVSCECLGASKGLVCWHSAAALSLHIGIARQRQTITT